MNYNAQMFAIFFAKTKGIFDAAIHANHIRERGHAEAFTTAFFAEKKGKCFSCQKADACPFLAVVVALSEEEKGIKKAFAKALNAVAAKLALAREAAAPKMVKQVAKDEAQALVDSIVEEKKAEPMGKASKVCLRCNAVYSRHYVFCPLCSQRLALRHMKEVSTLTMVQEA